MFIPRNTRLYRMVARIFPPSSKALVEGILCHGGNLSPPMLLGAYSRGIFPWFNPGEPILWWTPATRCVILPKSYHLPRRASRNIRRLNFQITLDQAFNDVLQGCSRHDDTWLGSDMKAAYSLLHTLGFAHSVEAWLDGELAGGLYGVALGRAFFGESMFHTVTEASRACLAALAGLLLQRGVELLDCQQETRHIMAQGGMLLARDDFEGRLAHAMAHDASSQDALTLEYEDDTALRADIWPFLPWRAAYEHRDGVWLERDPNAHEPRDERFPEREEDSRCFFGD